MKPLHFEASRVLAAAAAPTASAAAKDYTVKTYGAVEGLWETLERLGEQVATNAGNGRHVHNFSQFRRAA